MASEYDRLFPAKKVLKRVKNIIPNCTTHELKGRGHLHLLTKEEKNMIKVKAYIITLSIIDIM